MTSRHAACSVHPMTTATTTSRQIRHTRHAVRCAERFVRLGILDRAADVADDVYAWLADMPRDVAALLLAESASTLAAVEAAEDIARGHRAAFSPGTL